MVIEHPHVTHLITWREISNQRSRSPLELGEYIGFDRKLGLTLYELQGPTIHSWKDRRVCPLDQRYPRPLPLLCSKHLAVCPVPLA